jgi:ABC-type lipoprotein export system ATPase subunit
LACGAMQKPTCGTVTLEKQNVYALSVAKRARYRAGQIGYLFQTLQLLPYLNALDNVQLVPGVSGDTAKQWLVRLGLENRLHHKPDSLSHGQRQRVALARAIAHQPALIIADEPTGNLDPKHAQLVFDTLREFANDGGSVLIASHDPAVASIADQTYSLQSGTLADVGAAV